ncbi:hypothetical protein [Natronobiforma cellulositropha]|uniref:hypothetical protein n=1 Tax=Natronobiforma cellulositropha TaxID=1679076 RepID=UPI0021D5BE82|nr:hypothetical protein [Natronobiforma cellulositropha]
MSESIAVDDLVAAVHCPRRYEYAAVYGLDGEERSSAEAAAARRHEYCRRAICAALRTGETDPDALLERARTRLADHWHARTDGVHYHSYAQRDHERRVHEATLRAYADRFAEAHASGLATLRERTDGELVGPDLPLSSTVTAPGSDEAITLESRVDLVFLDESSLVGVRFVPTLSSLGLLRYRGRWEGDVADRFEAHVDAADETFDPGPVGALYETAATLDGLRAVRDRLELGDHRCRYRHVALAAPGSLRVNWVRDAVEVTLESTDLTDVFLDHHTYGMTLEHRNRAVESRLAALADALASGQFDPHEQWETISSHSCPSCPYAVCCGDHLGEEVRFDG